MSWTSRARHSAAVTAARGRRYLLRTRPGRRVVRPDISVIVPFYNVEAYFEQCLESIRAGGVANIEVLLVDDGSPDSSRDIAERYVRMDRRFRIVTRPNGGLGAARNTGVREARGRWLTFVDSDDELMPGALAELLSAAKSSGSQIVIGSVQRFDSTTQWAPTWVREVHKHQLTGIRAEDNLSILRNLYTWNKLFRKDFWDAQDLWFREGVAYEDQPIITELFVAADTMDVLPTVVYRYRARDDGSSISQQTGTMKDLRDRVSAWRATEAALHGTAEPVRLAWLQTLFDAHFNWYLMSSGTTDDDYWQLLQTVVTELVDGAPQELWDRAPARNRVLLELTRQNRRADVQEYVRQDALKALALFDADLGPRGIDFKLPFRDDPDLADELFLIRPEQMTLGHRLDEFRRVGDELQVAGWAYVLKVDLARHDQQVAVVVREERTGIEHVFAADSVPDFAHEHDLQPPDFDDWSDYRPGRFTARLPLSLFEGGPWNLCLRVTVGGHEVQDVVTKLFRRGPLGLPPALPLPDGRARLAAQWRAGHPLVLRRVPTTVAAVDIACEDRTVSGRLVGRGAAKAEHVEAAVNTFVVRSKVDEEGRFSLTLPQPPQLGTADSARWSFRTANAAEIVVEDLARIRVPGESSELSVEPDRRHALTAADRRTGVEFTSVESTEDGRLRLSGVATGLGIDQVRVTLSSLKTTAVPHTADVVGGRFVVDVPVEHQVFRFGALPLPIGVHQVEVEVAHAGAWRATESTNSSELIEELPVLLRVPLVRGSVGRGSSGALELQLIRPTGAGSTRQSMSKLVREASTRRGQATTRGILFRSYFGEKATDNGVAIQAELARRGSDLPAYWAVQDHSTPVPEGGIPVVVNTPEWFDLLSTVRYYVDNMYQPTYHQKPEGQVLVQTFHGYPFKQMGLPHWRKQHFAQSLIDSYGERSAEWDHLVSPASYATPLLTRDFGYGGSVLEIGYPRNDVLFAADRDRIREETRASLGIRPDQQVVLYAPTFRDYLSRNNNDAAMSDFLDFEEIRQAFGDDVVVLMRGHAFNARTNQRVGSSGTTIDVTDYPEVSDLYLAADVCIADYSSLRFDFALTGKPMIFLVPDLQRYVDTRGWLFDFGPTAPGPQVSTTEEVVHHLRNLDAMVAEYADAYATFRADYLDLEDGHAAARFVDAVIVPRGDA